MNVSRGGRSASGAAGHRRRCESRAPDGARVRYGAARPARTRAQRRWRVVFWVALVVFAMAVAALAAIAISYARGSATYADLARAAFSEQAEDGTASDESVDGEAGELATLSVDWDALLAANPDTVGWVYIPGTTINYPVVYSGDDSRYLIEDFYGETNPLVSYGAIFLSGVNSPDLTDDCNIVYGHHLMNGEMFSPIAGLADEAAFNDHRTVYFLTPEGSCRLRSFALLHVPSTDAIVQPNFGSTEELEAYVRDKMERSAVTPDDEVPQAAVINRVFAFSTCDNLASDGRYVLCCYVEESSNPHVPAIGDLGAELAVSQEDAGAVGEAARTAMEDIPGGQ